MLVMDFGRPAEGGPFNRRTIYLSVGPTQEQLLCFKKTHSHGNYRSALGLLVQPGEGTVFKGFKKIK